MGSGQPDYMNVTLLKGQDSSGNLITIAVDEDGNLISTMKGDYEGTLKTLAVDEEGRILAVLSDPEDVTGNAHYMGFAELATRLGSICYYDRRGEVFFMDGFEHSMSKWTEAGSGTGRGAAVDNTYAKDGEYSCEITTGDAIDDIGAINHVGGGLIKSRIGLELSFMLNVGMDLFAFSFTLRSTTNKHNSGITYDPTNDTLSYLDSSGGYTVFATGIDIRIWQGTFHTLKFVIDANTGHYVRCSLDYIEYDLSACSYQLNEDGGKPYHRIDITAVNSHGSNRTINIDNVILTQNEPSGG